MSRVATSYCGVCQAEWRAPEACHAPCCHELFESIVLFDAHRVRGRCLDPAMLDDREGSPLMAWDGVMWRRAATVRSGTGN